MILRRLGAPGVLIIAEQLGRPPDHSPQGLSAAPMGTTGQTD